MKNPRPFPRFSPRGLSRRLSHLLPLIVAGAMSMSSAAQAAGPVVEVYKSASCGCCTGWVDHLQENGFTVKAHDVDNPSDYRQKFGIPKALASCHSATVQGYALEGHVPAAEIKRLLAERPKATGLAVPAMPMGSPGMEGPRSDPYDVLLVDTRGNHATYRHYDAK